jgi:prepilin-type N-terminal cleavage/methylation domain-containing protein
MTRVCHGVVSDTAGDRTAGRRQGFTLLEILVAMSILVVIVLLLTQMFHQSSIAWDSGMRKVDLNMETRAVLSAMTLELTQAVGDDVLQLNMTDDSTEVLFHTLKKPTSTNRAVERVFYQWSGDGLLRQTRKIQPQAAYATLLPSQQSTFLTNVVDVRFKVPVGGPYITNLPPWLDVLVVTRREGESRMVTVKSCGRDGISGTEDDISTSEAK